MAVELDHGLNRPGVWKTLGFQLPCKQGRLFQLYIQHAAGKTDENYQAGLVD